MNHGKVIVNSNADDVAAWWEPGREDHADARTVVATADRFRLNGETMWDIIASIDGKTVLTATLMREGRQYAWKVCRRIVQALGATATHKRRWRANKKRMGK